MYLLIDWGNTRLKFLLIDDLSEFANQPHSVEKNPIEPDIATSVTDLATQLEKSGNRENIVKVLIASVRSEQDNQELADALNQFGLTLFFAKTSQNACGVECAYQEPQQLGIDRWLAIIAGYQTTNHKTGQTLCIIDMGSAVTLDIIDPVGRHLGGHILPGKKLLYESLLKTAKVRADSRLTVAVGFELGRTTNDCVNFGVEQMILGYLICSMRASNHKYGVNQWLITGGDGAYWIELLQNSDVLFKEYNMQHWPTLVFKGLAKLYLEK